MKREFGSKLIIRHLICLEGYLAFRLIDDIESRFSQKGFVKGDEL